jgi:hypothetical protein
MDTLKTNTEPKPKKGIRKSKVYKFIRNLLIGFIVLVFILVGAGVAYVWYMGQYGKVEAVDEEPVSTTVKVHSSPKIAANAKEGVSIQALSSPVKPGDNASIDVKTNPESKCSIKVEYNKIPSKDSGLATKTADEYGLAAWSWTVDGTAPVGKWPVTVTCVWNKKTAVVIGDLIVKK